MKKTLTALLISAILCVTACSGQPQESTVNSAGTAEAVSEEPQRPDISGLTSQEIVSSMTIGWNLGNTLDACQADRDGDQAEELVGGVGSHGDGQCDSLQEP